MFSDTVILYLGCDSCTLISMNPVGVQGFSSWLGVRRSWHRGVAVHCDRWRQSRNRCGCNGRWTAGTCTHVYSIFFVQMHTSLTAYICTNLQLAAKLTAGQYMCWNDQKTFIFPVLIIIQTVIVILGYIFAKNNNNCLETYSKSSTTNIWQVHFYL